MGEYKAPNGTRSFTPDDTDSEFYLESNYSTQRLSYIIETAKAKWGDDIDLDDLLIEPEYIHTACLGHDRYDPGDWTRFLRIEYSPT